MRIAGLATIFTSIFLLAACGDTTEERAATGGVAGTVAGAAVGAPLAGAAIGAGAGAVTD